MVLKSLTTCRYRASLGHPDLEYLPWGAFSLLGLSGWSDSYLVVKKLLAIN